MSDENSFSYHDVIIVFCISSDCTMDIRRKLFVLSHFLIHHCLSMGMVLWPVLSGDDSTGSEPPLSPPERLPIRRSSTRDKHRRGETCFLLTTGDYTCASDGGIRKGRHAFNQILTGDLAIKCCKYMECCKMLFHHFLGATVQSWCSFPHHIVSPYKHLKIHIITADLIVISKRHFTLLFFFTFCFFICLWAEL